MSFWNDQSIARKITRMNLTVCGIALVLAYFSFLMYDFYTLRQTLRTDLDTEAQIIGSNCEAALLFDDPQAAQTTLAALRGSPHVLAATIFTEDHQTFATYTRQGSGSVTLISRILVSRSLLTFNTRALMDSTDSEPPSWRRLKRLRARSNRGPLVATVSKVLSDSR